MAQEIVAGFQLECAHRMGDNSGSFGTAARPRNIVAKFLRFKDREVVRQTTGARRLDSFFFFFFFFFAFSPVWRPLRYVHAIILPLKPFLSILNQPSSMGYYIDKVGNAVS